MTTAPLVVCIDDDPDFLRLYRRAFRHSRSFELMTFELPSEALDWIPKRLDQIQLVFTDYRMPILSGTEVLAELRRLDPDLPVICVTGVDVDQFDSKNFTHVLDKPFDMADLTRQVQQHARPAIKPPYGASNSPASFMSKSMLMVAPTLFG